MMGRTDLGWRDGCATCQGTGKDPRKRKRPCPACDGKVKTQFCESCGHDMPCPGTTEGVLDQSSCDKPVPEVRRAYLQRRRDQMDACWANRNQPLTMPVVKRSFLCDPIDLVSVQPMAKPVGLVFYLDYQERGSVKDGLVK